MAYAQDLLSNRRYDEVLRGIGRVSTRLTVGKIRELGDRVVRSGYGRQQIDAKRERLNASLKVEAKTSLTFPGPSAPLLISVVIPCFNYGKYLEEAVQSVLSQTVVSCEAIVVDDGSTDTQTHTVLAQLEKLPRVRILKQQNQGLPSARNAGILLARGEYICCLDADDTLEPTYLELAIAVLEADHSVGFAYSWVRLFGDEVGVWKTRDFDIDEALLDNHTAVSAVFRRDDWLTAGGYRAGMRHGYEDWEFWLRLASLGRRGRVVRTPLFNHRRHGLTMTHAAHALRHSIKETFRESNPSLFDGTHLCRHLRTLGSVKPHQAPFAVFERDGVLTLPNEKPHLLVLAPWLAMGGAECLLLDVLDALQADWRITIVTTLPDQQETWTKFRAITPDIVALFRAFDKEQWPQVLDHIVRTRCTRVVLSHGSAFAYEALPALKDRHPQLRTVDILHNDLPGGHIRGALGASDAIDRHVAVSDRIARSLQRHGINAGRIKTIANGVDAANVFSPDLVTRTAARDHFGLPRTGLVIAWIGRLSEEKRPLEFVKIVDALRSTYELQAIMVGDGNLRSALEAYIAGQGVGDLIKRIFHIEREEIATVYAAADFLVLTSSVEGMPLTVLEAMATGCPVAATDVGNLRALIESGVNGFLVPPDRPLDIAGVLEPFADPAFNFATLRSAARQSVIEKGFDLASMQDDYRALLNEFAFQAGCALKQDLRPGD